MDIAKVKRILIVRTDRIGDVVLSTPVITAVRAAFPEAYIAVMVSPQTREIVSGNPYLNEVIAYDKISKHKEFLKTFLFANWLRGKRFDLALILHSTIRINIICCLAGIPRRIGYARGKMDFLLTHRLEYVKRLGEKHEIEYSLDVLRSLGVKAEPSPLVMPLKESVVKEADSLLFESGLKKDERFVVISPGASCVSRIWPSANFARLADILKECFGLSTVLVSGPEEVKIGEKVRESMSSKPVFLCGRTSLGVLAAVLKRASLLISNDSGPVHIACVVKTPVISIFSRKQKGLSPTRWGPYGERNAIIHKDVGCVKCLAHNCSKGFLCLYSITVEEVLEKARELL
ncbi:MAG: lipopolysaccharide heptosyltransferase II [Candidatus Omnitrophica bacterium]|nr:lipopolysaccharide heptosyltransferase II [Candidatus Omnitrophota bacterium]MBU1933059.1 lipopolysaccharide heptosyltransferase II [Candidatus Omnitrophota bacterium]